jgi:hypothetical protein
MPISDEALQNARNNFIAVRGEATVGQAIAALQAKGGQPWWHLLVRQADGSWGVLRFTDLYVELERMSMASEIPLSGRKGLTTATAVDRDSMETKAAQALALKSPGGFLVVTVDGMPVGILVEKVSRSGLAISSAKLNDLGGKYVNLKDYGSILLSSSKSQAGRLKPGAPGGNLKG